jgi:hypothetical protein
MSISTANYLTAHPHPKTPKPPKKNVKNCPIISTSPSEPDVQNSLN